MRHENFTIEFCDEASNEETKLTPANSIISVHINRCVVAYFNKMT